MSADSSNRRSVEVFLEFAQDTPANGSASIANLPRYNRPTLPFEMSGGSAPVVALPVAEVEGWQVAGR